MLMARSSKHKEPSFLSWMETVEAQARSYHKQQGWAALFLFYYLHTNRIDMMHQVFMHVYALCQQFVTTYLQIYQRVFRWAYYGVQQLAGRGRLRKPLLCRTSGGAQPFLRQTLWCANSARAKVRFYVCYARYRCTHVYPSSDAQANQMLVHVRDRKNRRTCGGYAKRRNDEVDGRIRNLNVWGER